MSVSPLPVSNIPATNYREKSSSYSRMQSLILLLFFLITVPIDCIPLQINCSNITASRVPVFTGKECEVVAPKVVIISMFSPEASIWYENANTNGSIGNLLERNITVPGLSPLFPQIHCLRDGSVCQVTTGESEINAATTMTALIFSPLFDFRKTYFMIAGAAGVNPKYGTICDVAFSKYAIQVALQYEFDIRDLPKNFTSGYIPQGATLPDQYPGQIYGTEVFEVNENLRNLAVEFASRTTLKDSPAAQLYRAHYSTDLAYKSATKNPGILRCDVATSDNYFSGAKLGEIFENTTRLFTNGSGIYCMTAQEDNAILEVMVRAAIIKIVDFSRIIILRTASDFDRPYPGQSGTDNLFYMPAGIFEAAISNIYVAGTPVIQGILSGWNSIFENGITATNYIGDILGSLGGEPDFGPTSISIAAAKTTMRRVASPMITSRSRIYRLDQFPNGGTFGEKE